MQIPVTEAMRVSPHREDVIEPPAPKLGFVERLGLDDRLCAADQEAAGGSNVLVEIAGEQVGKRLYIVVEEDENLATCGCGAAISRSCGT